MLENLKYYMNLLRAAYHNFEIVAIAKTPLEVGYHESRIRELAVANIALAKRLGKNTRRLEEKIQ